MMKNKVSEAFTSIFNPNIRCVSKNFFIKNKGELNNKTMNPKVHHQLEFLYRLILITIIILMFPTMDGLLLLVCNAIDKCTLYYIKHFF